MTAGTGDPFSAHAAPALPSFRHVGDELVHRGWAISTVRARFLDPDGTPFERDVIRHPGAAAVVPWTDDGCVVVVHQFRPAVDSWIFEIPAGTLDVEGEAPLACARRELAEEVGYQASQMELLTSCRNTPGFCDEVTHVYLATGLTAVPTARQGIEEAHMRTETLPLSRFDDLVADGTIIDAVTILAIALARHRLAGGSDG